MTLTRLITGILAILTTFASIAEIVLASWVLHYLHILHDEVNYSYDGVEASGDDSTIPYSDINNPITFTFYQPWVFDNNSLIKAIPRTELAAGVICFIFGLFSLAYILEKVWSARNSGSRYVVQYFRASDSVAAILLPVLALGATAVAIYAFSASEYSVRYSMLSISSGLSGAGYDATPSWEVWTCAVSSFLEDNPDVLAARSEWKTVCQLTRGAKWALIPVFVLPVVLVAAFAVTRLRVGTKK